jgi:hypothetical protein
MPPEQVQGALDLRHFVFDVGTHGGAHWNGERGGYLSNLGARLKTLEQDRDLTAFFVPGDLRDFPWTEGVDDGEKDIHA